MPDAPPSDATLDTLLAPFSDPIRALVLATRDAILEIQPAATERVWMGWKNVGYATGPAMSDVRCMVSPASRWVRVSFVDRVPDPEGLLGEPGAKGSGHLRLTSAADLERPAVSAMLRAAFADVGPAAGGEAPQAREKRERTGGYQAGASRTVDVPLAALYRAWADDDERRRWLPDEIVVRKANVDKSLRVTWPDGSSLEVLFYAKGEGRSTVQLDHRKLADDATVERMRAYWKERLAALKAQLEA